MEMTTTPTPGPYFASTAPGNLSPDIMTPGGICVAVSHGPAGEWQTVKAEHEANAHLLASSWDFAAACTPERLDALEDLLRRPQDRIDSRDELCRELLASLRAAVAKSQGGGRTP